MKKFEVGKTYSMRSVCDHNCVWQYVVMSRTPATVTLYNGNIFIKCRINKEYSEYRNAETVFPLGRYSMQPILSA